MLSDSTLARDVDDLAQQIAGKDVSPELRERARLVAAAEVDVIRVRRARLDLIVNVYTDDDYDSPVAAAVKKCIARHTAKFPGIRIPQLLIDMMDEKPTGAEKLALVVCDLAGELMRLDRYERRALSRRKFAIREFDAARRP